LRKRSRLTGGKLSTQKKVAHSLSLSLFSNNNDNETNQDSRLEEQRGGEGGTEEVEAEAE
jgi:hypothetical protein